MSELDERIQNSVKRGLRTQGFSNITVSVKDQIVHLSGQVTTLFGRGTQ